MESHEALKDCIGSLIAEMAKRVRLSKSTIYKWTEASENPTDSGTRNPLDVLDEIIDEAKRRGRADLAYAPIYWLNQEHGLIAIRMPEASKQDQLNMGLITCIKEFAELASATSDALADNRVNIPERKRIIREGEEAMRAIATLIEIVKEAAL